MRAGGTFSASILRRINRPTATLASAARSERLRNAAIPAASGPRTNGTPSATASSGYRSCSQLIKPAPVRRAAASATSETSGGSVLATTRSPGRLSSARRRQADR
jgi:hypothetical protein